MIYIYFNWMNGRTTILILFIYRGYMIYWFFFLLDWLCRIINCMSYIWTFSKKFFFLNSLFIFLLICRYLTLFSLWLWFKLLFNYILKWKFRDLGYLKFFRIWFFNFVILILKINEIFLLLVLRRNNHLNFINWRIFFI